MIEYDKIDSMSNKSISMKNVELYLKKWICYHYCMSTQKIRQNIHAIQAWAQASVILTGTQKNNFVQWCEDLSTQLEQACLTPLKVGLIGGTGVGKSTIINRLAGSEISVAHNERPYTNKVVVYHFYDTTSQIDSNHPHMVNSPHDRKEISHLILFDFPDYDSHLSQHRSLVQELSQKLDIIVWVASPEKYADQAMIHMMSNLVQSSKNYCFVLNKADQLQTDESTKIIGHWYLLLKQAGIIEVPVFSFSARNDHDDMFINFQDWLFKKRSEHELVAITHANIENQITHKTKEICHLIDCQQIAIVVEDLNKQMNQLNIFNNMRQKDILDIITPDAQTSIHQYLSRQTRFFWTVSIAFGVICRLRQLSLSRPNYKKSRDSGEFFLKTIDDAIAQIQTFPAVPNSKISLLKDYRQFIAQYQNPNQIAPLLGKPGFLQSTCFWMKQWLVLCIPVLLWLIYLSGMHQLSSIESIDINFLLRGCLQFVIKIFQADGLIAMMSLLLIEFLLSMHLASGWHKKLARQSEVLYHMLARNICKQLMLSLHESIQPLNDWANQAQLDCETLHKELL
jgi:ribosome biogenesis GTPase A